VISQAELRWHPAAVLQRLDHAVIAVRDLDRGAAVLGALLGLRASWRGEHPGAGTANVLFRLANTYLEVLAPVAPGPLADALRARLAASGEGLVALAFGTADAGAARAAFAARGLEPGPVEDGLGRDVESGAFRQWRRVSLSPARTRGLALFAIEQRSPPELLPPATPAGDPRAAVHALDHVVIQTGDADAARALFGEALGLRLALDRRFDDWGVRLLFFRTGGVTVEVAARLDGASGPGAADRLWGLSYRVADADGARARLAAAGFDASPVRPGRKPGTRVLTVRGEPCGVATLLLEPPPAA
jgi:catechol 2,3-dioxygenase-like lactoylglutathione lyase family enzyme